MNDTNLIDIIEIKPPLELDPGPQPHPISADQPARSAQLLKRSTPANSLKQMRANLRIGYVNQSRPSPSTEPRNVSAEPPPYLKMPPFFFR